MDWVELIVPHTDDLAGEVRGDELVIWVPAHEAEAEAARLRAQGLPVRMQAAMPEAEWRDAWKRYFKTTRIGERLVIVPSWETYAPIAGDVVLDLDPGQAFGTGAHATTRLCLHALERLSDVRRFLDMGTGSGILSIAAAKLWPEATGVAWDNDPQALEAARENLARNGVLDRVALARPEGRFDVVVANIQADVLMAMKDELVARCDRRRGRLILAGILAEQAEGVIAHFGLPVEHTETLDGWTTIVHRPTGRGPDEGRGG